MIGYKVVSQRNKKLESWCFLPSVAGVRYVIGKETRPQTGCGPLCVFSSLRSVQENLPNLSDPIYRCYFTPSRKRSVWRKDKETTPLSELPNGTRLATSVTLLERIF